MLSETGVCSPMPGGGKAAASGCCGGPAPAASTACCTQDHDAKAAGEPSCGCGSTSKTPEFATA